MRRDRHLRRGRAACTVEDVCDGTGTCAGGAPLICEDEDGNPCTAAECDPKAGCLLLEPAVPDGEYQDACLRYDCTAGSKTLLGPTPDNICADQTPPEGSCIGGFVCDPAFAGTGDTHCKPVGAAEGTRCRVSGAGVNPASSFAAEGEESVCAYYLCHDEDGDPQTLPECRLSSALDAEAQAAIEAKDLPLGHTCSLDTLPEEVHPKCNRWACGCMDGSCAEAECRAEAIDGALGQACDDGNLCDESTCQPGKPGQAPLACEPAIEGAGECDVFPEALCDVALPCNPDTGCSMDQPASDEQCAQLHAHPCLDGFNTFCSPQNPGADPTTGCVVAFDEPGSACTKALADGCVLTAACQAADEGGAKCVPTETVDCDDTDPCTNDFCEAGKCQHTELAAGLCDDGDACTEGDGCVAGTCVGAPVACDDSDACTLDTCSAQAGCEHEGLACDDGDACTADACEPSSGCASEPVDCGDGEACTQDLCDSELGCAHPLVDCDDGDACTEDLCTGEEGCVNLDQGAACLDDDACTLDGCDLDSGCTSEVQVCADDDACTEDGCDELLGCIFQDLTATCDDGDACTEDGCNSLEGCVHGALGCDDEVACTEDGCDPDSGCHSTTNDLLCGEGTICLTEVCDGELGCMTQALEGECEDGDPCTWFDICVEGVCEGLAFESEGPTCDGVDEDCDGATDEDCVYLIRAGTFGDGVEAAADNGTFFMLQRIGTPRYVVQGAESSTNGTYSLRPGLPRPGGKQ